MHRVVAQLRLCGEEVTKAELIDKTLSTFPPASSLLAQQYRNINYKSHSELMAYLLLAEKQHQILIKNADSAPSKEAHNVEIPKRKSKEARPDNAHKGSQKTDKSTTNHETQSSRASDRENVQRSKSHRTPSRNESSRHTRYESNRSPQRYQSSRS